MHSNKRTHTIVSLAVMAALLIAAGGFLAATAAPDRVLAAPEAAPTPVSAIYSANATMVSFYSATTLDTDDNTAGKQLSAYETLDLVYTIDQGATPNPITMTLQFSNDNSNWADGLTIVANNSADATAMQQFNNFGRYTRVNTDLGNSEDVVVTVSALAKQGTLYLCPWGRGISKPGSYPKRRRTQMELPAIAAGDLAVGGVALAPVIVAVIQSGKISGLAHQLCALGEPGPVLPGLRPGAVGQPGHH